MAGRSVKSKRRLHLLQAAAAFEDFVEQLDVPAAQIQREDGARRRESLRGQRGEQDPHQRVLAGRRMGFARFDHGELDRGQRAAGRGAAAGRLELYPDRPYFLFDLARGAPNRLGTVPFDFLEAGGRRHAELEGAQRRGRGEPGADFFRPGLRGGGGRWRCGCGRSVVVEGFEAAVFLAAHEQLGDGQALRAPPRVFGEHFVDVAFAVADGDDLAGGHLGRERARVAVACEPAETFLFLDGPVARARRPGPVRRRCARKSRCPTGPAAGAPG